MIRRIHNHAKYGTAGVQPWWGFVLMAALIIWFMV